MKWLYTAVLVPLANLVTLGALQPYLLSETTSWVLGAAIVTAAGAFRKAHEYLGYFGMVNAWFIGMVFFYLALNYGLITAIVAHILYDVIIFTLRALLSEPGSPYRFARFAD